MITVYFLPVTRHIYFVPEHKSTFLLPECRVALSKGEGKGRVLIFSFQFLEDFFYVLHCLCQVIIGFDICD